MIKKGDIFVTSWGYDQTNYDYIIVIDVSPTGKTAVCRMTGYKDRGASSQCNIQEPTASPYGDIFRMRIQQDYHGNECLKGSYPFCASGTGSTRLDRFSKVTQGQQFAETDAMFGH